MRKLLLTLSIALLTCFGTQAQTIYVYPQTSGTPEPVPQGGYPTFTAIVNGTNDKTVTWSTTGGTLVGTNPCVVNEPCTIALHSATTTSAITVTATTNAGTHATATATVQFVASPVITTSHPRLGGITSSMVSALTAKATVGNMMYNNGAYYLGTDWYTYWSGIWSYSNTGGTGQPSSDQTPFNPQDQALWFCELGLVDPADATYHWGAYCHDQFMYQAVMSLMPLNTMYSGGSASFRNNQNVTGMSGNVGGDSNPAWTLTPDLLMADTNGSGKWAMDGTGATMTATLTSGTMNLPTITAAGSGYTPSTVLYWFAPIGSSGCADIGSYGNAQAFNGGDNGTQMAAMGVVQTNSSGGVAGTVTVLNNATGCTSPPVITIKSDKQLIRDYFYVIGQTLTQQNCCGYVPAPGTYNSSAVYDTSSTSAYGNVRAMGNNYNHSHIMHLIAAALTFDDNTTDDPNLPNTCSAARHTVCPDGTAGSLHAYWYYFAGSMAYLEWIHIDDPAVVQAAYTSAYGALGSTVCNDNVTSTVTVARVNCFGDGRDGESSEGNWYQYSIYRETQAMASIHSAGYDDPLLYGPQVSYMYSSWWDLKENYDLAGLTYIYSLFGSNVYAYLSTGDTLSLFRAPSDFTTAAWLGVFDAATGRTDRTVKATWPLLYTPIGGISDFYTDLHNDNGSANAWPMFLFEPSGDPTASPPSDPRPSLPPDQYSGNNQHDIVRSGWVANGPTSPTYGGSSTQQFFDILCQNSRIDHEHGTCPGFSVLSNGEYITKTRTVDESYDYYLSSSEHANELALAAQQTQSACTVVGGCFLGWSAQGLDFWFAQTYVANSLVINGSTIYRCNTTAPTLCASTDIPGPATMGDVSGTFTAAASGTVYLSAATGGSGAITSVTLTFPSAPTPGNTETIVVATPGSGTNNTISDSFSVTLSGATTQTFVAGTDYSPRTKTASEILGYWVPSSSTVPIPQQSTGNSYGGYYLAAASSLPVGSQTYTSCTPAGCGFPIEAVITAPDWSSTTTTRGGGQPFHGQQGGTFTAYHAELPAYLAYIVDSTQAYNFSQSGPYSVINGVTAASRSLIYQRTNKRVIYYDRGATASTPTRDFLTTTGALTVTGNTTKWSTQSGGQDAYLTMVYPTSGVTISDAGAFLTTANGGATAQGSDWEPFSHVLEDAGSPASAQFLNVLEWGASGFSKSTTSLVSSTSGQTFDGALVGSTLTMFMRAWPTSFTGVTYPASGATTDYVSDLTPNTSYTITGAGTPGSATTDTAGVLTFSATGTGNITVAAGAPPATVTTLQGVTIRGAIVQ